MLEKIIEIIAEQLGCDENSITEASSISEDLGADSLELVEMLMAIEEYFEISIPDEQIVNLKTVSDIVSYVESNI